MNFMLRTVLDRSDIIPNEMGRIVCFLCARKSTLAGIVYFLRRTKFKSIIHPNPKNEW